MYSSQFSLYNLNGSIVPVDKAPAAYHEPSNIEFNLWLAKSQVCNNPQSTVCVSQINLTPSISVLMPYIKWTYLCMILHNILANLSDLWEEMFLEITALEPQGKLLDSENL